MFGPEQILALALSCAPQVEPRTVQAIVKRESRGNPYAIGVGKGVYLSHQPSTRDQALYVASILEKAGIDFDVGLMQVRTTNLRRLGISVQEALEPCKNMGLGQTVLLDGYARAVKSGRMPGTDASLAAVSHYNTGSLTAGFSNGYVANVVQEHRRGQ